MTQPNAARRRRELAAIHAARRQLGLPEDDYRDLLEAWTGQRSSAALSAEQRHVVIEGLRRMGFVRRAGDDRVVILDDDKPQTAKIKALWLGLWRAGRVQSPSLHSLNAFVRRLTGVSSVNWLSPVQANIVIESLKQWSERP